MNERHRQVVEDNLDEEGEEMVADDAKKRKHSDTIGQSSRNRRAEIHRKDEGIRGGRSKGGKWKQSDQDTNTRTPEKPNVRTRWVALEFKWTALTVSITLQLLDWNW